MRQVLFWAHAIFVTLSSSTEISDASSKCEDESISRCTCFDDGKLDRVIVDCSNSGLNSVPENMPLNVTHLYLDSNNITTLQNESFGRRRFPNLIFLGLKHNRLTKIYTGVFQVLDKLKNLNLYNNSLKYKKSLPGPAFLSLSQSLKVLDMRMNLLGANVHYPPSVGELYNLEELRMDCLRDQSLPSEYSNLKQLGKLVLSGGRKHVGLLGNNLFTAVKDLNITEVDLAGLDIGVIGKQTFFQLPNLKKLDLSNNNVLNLQFHIFASSLKNTSIKSLMLNNTGIGGSGLEGTSIKIKEFCGLNLKTFTLDSNQINGIGPIFKTCFPELEILSLADNYLPPDLTLWLNILQLRNLIGINTSSQYSFSRVHHKRDISSISASDPTITPAHVCGSGMACPLWLPPKMEWIDVSHNGVRAIRLPELALIRNSTLRYFNGSYCGIQTIQLPVYCVHSVVSTVVPQLETIDISNNNLQCVNATFFDGSITHCDWRSLKHIYLSNNKLGLVEGNICNQDQNNTLGFLKPLRNLRTLILAGNMLDSEKLSDLQVLNRLEKLDLSSNGFHNFSLDLSNMTNLQKLDLSNNNIQCLSKSTIGQLNQIRNSSSNIQIDLSGNVLSCTCECLHLFVWMSKSELNFMSRTTYQCVFKDGRKVPLKRLSFIITKLESQCHGRKWLQWSIGAELCTYTLVTVSCLLYRRRHDIRYFLL